MADVVRKRIVSTPKNNPWPEALYELRLRMGWEQTDAAAQIPVNRVTWARWETGAKLDSITQYALRALIAKHAPDILKKITK